MGKKIIWMLVSCLMVLSLVMASCGPAAEEEEEEEVGEEEVIVEEEEEEEEEEVVVSKEAPEYGGTITLSLLADPTWDLLSLGAAAPHQLSHQRVWDGDWAKGPAGGYGTNEVDWGESTHIPALQAGYLAEDIYWEVDTETQEVTTTIQVRQGVHWALTDSEASRLVGGREVTTDDIVWNLNQRMNNPESMNYQLYPQIREIHAVKTGPWEIQVTHPFGDHLEGIMRLFNSTMMFPPELWDKYEYESCTDWRNSVGTGPFTITDYVVGNMAVLDRNPNYWMDDPVGPGMGNQLPYLDRVRYIVMPDPSTRQAALRTANIDQMAGLNPEDSTQMSNQVPDLKIAARGSWYQNPLYMRTDLPPFNDVRVRRAMMMAINFEEINDSLYGGLGNILSWPYYYHQAYADMYLGLDDPEMPDSVRELYTYHPDKAKALLTDAGYPSGFKTKITLTQDQADYYSIIKDMWSKVDIDAELDVIEGGALISVAISHAYEMLAPFCSPCSTYPEQSQYTGANWINASLVDDSYVNEMAADARAAAVTDYTAAMKITKELMKYLLDQAYCIPPPRFPTYNLWWPWLKNYTGETSVGYFPGDSWVQYIWIDQALKESMGY